MAPDGSCPPFPDPLTTWDLIPTQRRVASLGGAQHNESMSMRVTSDLAGPDGARLREDS